MADQNKPACFSCFPQNIPKLELHAHLNGSLSPECLLKLSELKSNHSSGYNFTAFQDLKSCFDVFAIAHSLTDTPEAIKLATEYCIQEFGGDNVIYLELRSTPRKTESMNKSEYVAAIIEAIQESPKDKIITTLIISINRGNSVEEAFENIDVAIEYAQRYPEIVVGIDLCGNPVEGKFSDFVPVLNKARQKNLKITLHCGEVKNDSEVMEMIDFRPERLSHVTCLTIEAVKRIKELKIPVELCVTSNLKCKTVPSVQEHQLMHYYQTDHPFILGTDDKGVFDTTLSAEYEIVRETFKLNEEFFLKMNQNAVSFCFANDSVKNKLKFKLNQL